MGGAGMWSAGVWAALVLSGAIGVSLGLIGGGGSIITVPILVYVAGLPVPEAVAMSLAVVGTTAAVGGYFQARAGHVHGQAALIYGGTGMAGAALGAHLTHLVPAPVLMLLFAALIIWVGLGMARGQAEAEQSPCAECHPGKCAAAGLVIGVLTGFLGVGGGFLIVPALLRFARMPVPQAIGTSLVIIAVNSLAGFAAHHSDLGHGLDLGLAFTGAALMGLFGGLALGRHMKPVGLKRAFGGLSLLVAAYLIAMNVRPLLAMLAHHG